MDKRVTGINLFKGEVNDRVVLNHALFRVVMKTKYRFKADMYVYLSLMIIIGGCSGTAPAQSPPKVQTPGEDDSRQGPTDIALRNEMDSLSPLDERTPEAKSEPEPELDEPTRQRQFASGNETIAFASSGSGQLDVKMYPQFGHVYSIYCAAISPNNRYVLTGSKDESIRLWELESGILIRILDPETNVRSLAFSSDSKLAIAGDGSGRIDAWDVESGQKFQTISSRRGSTESQALGVFPDGKRVVAGYAKNNLHVWDLETGELIHALGGDERRFHGVKGYVRAEAGSLAILPDGQRVLGGYESGKIKLWNAQSGKLIWEINAHSGPVYSLAITKDGKYVFSGSTDGLKKWHIRKKRMIRHYSNLPTVRVIGLSSDGRKAWLGIGGRGSFLPNDNRVVLFDLKTGKGFDGEGINQRRFTNAVAMAPNGRVAVAGDGTGNLTVWDLKSGEIRQTIRGSKGRVNDMAVSPDGMQIATASMDKNIYLWDAEAMAQTAVLKGHKAWPSAVIFSPSGKYLLSSAGGQDDIRLWDLSTRKNTSSFSPGWNVERNGIAFTPDEKRVVSCNTKCEVRHFDAQTGRMINSYRVGDWCFSMNISRDGKRLLVGIDSDFHVRDLETGALIHKIGLPTNGMEKIVILPDGSQVAAAMPSRIFFLDIDKGEVVRSHKLRWEDAIVISEDGRYVATGNDRNVNLWDIESNKKLSTYGKHTRGISSIQFSASGRQLISSAKDGMTKIWNLETGRMVTMLTQDGEWLAYSDDGYFDASRRGGELAAMIKNMEGFRIDQLAVRNNRPDILLDRIGTKQPEREAHYRALYQARLRKLGLREEDLTEVYKKAPTATVLDIDKDGKQVDVRFTISDPQHDLAFYNIYVNDVPIYGSRGKPISGKRHTIDERVELSSGHNKIEVSALNKIGVESVRDGRAVIYKPTTQGDLYYLGFGVSLYKDPDLTLKYAAKDATDLETLFHTASGFRNVYTRTYVNTEVTKDAIKQAKDFLKQAGVDDTVLLFVAGHGLYGGRDSAKYYYVTYDTDLSRLEQTAADFESIENLLQGIAPRNKLFLMDTCQSGELSGEAQSLSINNTGGRQLHSRGIRAKKGQALGSAGAVVGIRGDRSRYIYNDLFRRSGSIVLSSSRGSELSYERDDFENGVFTEIVLKALSSKRADVNSDRRISTDELINYVTNQVSEVSSGLQHPVVDRDNLYVNFSLPMMSRVD